MGRIGWTGLLDGKGLGRNWYGMDSLRTTSYSALLSIYTLARFAIIEDISQRGGRYSTNCEEFMPRRLAGWLLAVAVDALDDMYRAQCATAVTSCY